MAQLTDGPVRKSLNTFVAPRLPKLNLPPLPPITDRKLRETVFTHISSRVLPKSFGSTMFLTDGQAGTDYEKLEHVGDALLGAAVKTMLHEMYPNFRQGTASTTYDKLVCNRTLAQIAVQYGLPEMVCCHVTQRHVLKKNEKVQASVFEAYVAGLYYSVLGAQIEGEDTPKASLQNSEDGSPRMEAAANNGPSVEEAPTDALTLDSHPAVGRPVSSPESSGSDASTAAAGDDIYEGLALLFEGVGSLSNSEEDSTSTSDELSADHTRFIASSHQLTSSDCSDDSPSPNGLASSDATIKPHQSRGQAYDAVFKWLKDLFEPIAQNMVNHLKVEEKRLQTIKDTEGYHADMRIPKEWIGEDIKARGGKATLHAENRIMDLPEYIEHKDDQWQANTLWRVVCRVADIDGKVWTAEATRHTKQAAANVAAWKVCVQMGVLGEDVQ
ncbi:hypothetical protein I316_01101 [Kwoniella heveanensis BCC8398]|uniref:RNase III domain-containing protein n=1 Tax=Kwoniella heveanensis BCC8398 TaxID=1296120 RepID=A0A1B9H1R9_9TREE|nr:hypothetical protein I316_01101 [Kwoniella heveanensis BCC8398]